ncbi:hypothetical protein M8J77_000105 [Diaphorina citri]|nr:hypothetical protein M8J77_000105 [Diaphorina citri]
MPNCRNKALSQPVRAQLTPVHNHNLKKEEKYEDLSDIENDYIGQYDNAISDHSDYSGDDPELIGARFRHLNRRGSVSLPCGLDTIMSTGEPPEYEPQVTRKCKVWAMDSNILYN